MNNQDLIKDIKENFEELNKRNNAEVKALINTIVRLTGRLKLEDQQLTLKISKITSDLKMAEVGETEFYKMNHPDSKEIRYNSGFYDSVKILKEELLSLLVNSDGKNTVR